MADVDTVPNRNIIILGGSYAGISTAHYLLKHVVPRLPGKDGYQVILVNASEETMCRPACPRAMISDDLLDQNKLFVRIPEQFSHYPKSGFRFIHGKSIDTDLTSRTVTIETANGKKENLPYHSLIIATGASASSPLHGPNNTISELKQTWTAFRTALPTAKSIIIAGGGPTGVETAGELGFHLNSPPPWYNIFSTPPKPQVPITLITCSPQLLPHLRPALAQKAESLLATLGVTVLTSTRVTAIDPPTSGITASSLAVPTTLTLQHTTTTDSNNTNTTSNLQADIFIPCTGTTPNTAFLPPALLATDGRVRTESATLRVRHPDAGPRVYALGDVADAARPAVHNVLAQVPVVGGSVEEDLWLGEDGDGKGSEGGQREGREGRKERKEFEEDTREMQLVPIGRQTGVGSAMGWRVPGWVVWAIKGRDYWLWTTGGLWSGRQW